MFLQHIKQVFKSTWKPKRKASHSRISITVLSFPSGIWNIGRLSTLRIAPSAAFIWLVTQGKDTIRIAICVIWIPYLSVDISKT